MKSLAPPRRRRKDELHAIGDRVKREHDGLRARQPESPRVKPTLPTLPAGTAQPTNPKAGP
jgi:hypothetical protein